MECESHGCVHAAAYKVYWPGLTAPALMCFWCALRVWAVGDAMGHAFPIEPIHQRAPRAD